jgi:pseudaminic acid synthase
MSQPFIVAEIAAAHNGSLTRALTLIDEAAKAGADAVKLQTWWEMALPGHRIESGPWAGRDLRDLYEEARTPYGWHEPLFKHARSLGLVPFSTPFDHISTDFLETLGCAIYKVASCEIIDTPLIRHIATKGCPMILSTGMATEDEISDALAAAIDGGLSMKDLTLLKCVAAYPAPAEDFNLETMLDLSCFGCDVGLSDHTLGSAVAVAATALGATVIEKHIGLDRTGPDGGFVMLPTEFRQMVSDCRTAAKAMGVLQYGPLPAEQDTFRLRRSLWVVKDVQAGDRVSADNVRALRPSGGLPPGALEPALNLRFTRDAVAGTPFTLSLVGASVDEH